MERRRAQRAKSAHRDTAFQRLVGEVFRLNGQLLATAEELARPMGVSPAGWQTVATLRDEPMTVAEIGRRLGMRRQSAQHNIGRLVRQGLVEMQPNPGHRGAPLATLTADGRQTMATLYGLQSDLAGRFTEGLGLAPADLDDLALLLRRLRERAAGWPAAHGGGQAPRPARRQGARRPA
jgi:DNA-binding MarR family transcriptional regulator